MVLTNSVIDAIYVFALADRQTERERGKEREQEKRRNRYARYISRCIYQYRKLKSPILHADVNCRVQSRESRVA